MKFFKKLLSATLATSMIFAGFTVNTSIVSAAPSISAGWNETLYAEWADANPDSQAVKVGYKLSSDSSYTYLEGDDLTYLVRPASSSGYGRVDIPGLKAGRYDISITASDGTVHERKGIKVYEYDRSGYAHWNYSEGIGGYNNDGTPKDNAIIVYVTDENKDTVEVPGYEGTTWSYSPSKGSPYTRTSEGIGNILNNNMKFIQQVTITDNHPLIIRLIGKVNVPKNLTPYGVKDPILGGGPDDNGNLAITKYGRNITIEGIGDDATVDGWGFTFSQTSTCPAEAGKSFEVRNITFKNYAEDALGFQGDNGVTCPIERVWVHNNTFYPGYCANPTESDKSEGDGSCDFKRGQYYTMSYNHYINCHKTNLVGSGTSDDQFYMTLHHNWYENVGSRQPLAANGNLHIYNTYFQGATSVTVDLRGKNATLLENNYFEKCKGYINTRNNTCIVKSLNNYISADSTLGKKQSGKINTVTNRADSGISDNTYKFPDGGSMADYDINTKYFYYDSVNQRSDVTELTTAEDVPTYVTTYAGPLHAFPETESGEIVITVKSGTTLIKDANITANGLTFKNNGDGTYSAVASLGAEYVITVSKEGYSNKVITSAVLNNDGDMFTAEANLSVDYDGYAVVKLTGGSENTPVTGAKVELDNGMVLVEQGNGIYKSAAEIAVGNYTAVITNTGDYIAPASAQAVIVKTTDAATEIHLDKYKGAVVVTVTAAADETQELDLSNASVYVGTTKLTNSGNGIFTGEVDINTSLYVYVNVPGWNTESITPAQLTAAKEGTASASAALRYKGELFTWNPTEGINTDEFFEVNASSYGSASKYPQTYDGEELTNAIKVESSTSITFTAPADGDLAIVTHISGSDRKIKIDGTSYSIEEGTNIYHVTAGDHVITKDSTNVFIYLLQYSAGEINPNPPIPGTTETSTEVTTAAKTTETTTETVTFDYTPVEFGEAVTNSGTGISVEYDAATDTWELNDSSTELAAELKVPVVTPITSGKVIVKGSASPSSESGKWAFFKVLGKTTDENGAEVESEIAALATDSNKMLTLRTDSKNYAVSNDKIAANKVYDYTFIIDLDTKNVSLTVNGKTYTGTINTTAVTGFGAITSVTGERNVKLSNTVIGVVNDGSAGLHDDIMWDVTVDLPVEGSNGLTVGETFYSNNEENGPVEFTDGDKTYALEDWLQPNGNPYAEDGFNPMNPGNTGIPVKGGFAKFTPDADGVFTMAVKTVGGKNTYVTDETGAVVTMVDNENGKTSYDIVRFNVTAGKSYHIFAGSSKICLYYLGYTAGEAISTSESTTENTTVSTTENTTNTNTESTTEPTTDEPDPTPVKIYGDATADGTVDIRDVTAVLDYVLRGIPFKNDFEYVDVDGSKGIDSKDVAMILQYILDKNFTLPRRNN
ncbi:MAG: dockerin type I domain-containing protein [Clostridia bacterium]|nr:dockerin type I domain-containing protein [Clostridia bacterium]